jgi:parallel beta-helix repeat protein
VNGKPLIYLENQSNQVINDDVGQIILVNCNNITIKDQVIQNTNYGINLRKSNACKIINNNVSNNNCGIYTYASDYNIISNNTINSNVIHGINLCYSNYNTISKNICNENNLGKYYHYGISLYTCDYNTIKNNICSKNGVGIACGTHSNDNSVESNIIFNNLYIGIKIVIKSDNNIITKNNITNNPFGLALDDVEFTSITENNFFENENSIQLNIVYYYRLKLFRPIYMNNNYWGESRNLPKFVIGDYRYVYMENPFELGFTLKWIYIDWNPSKELFNV